MQVSGFVSSGAAAASLTISFVCAMVNLFVEGMRRISRLEGAMREGHLMVSGLCCGLEVRLGVGPVVISRQENGGN